MSIFRDILAFSTTRDEWQQDALRRLVTQLELPAQDFEDIMGMLKVKAGLPWPSPATPTPLSQAHIPEETTDAPPVVLNSLGNLLNTDRLATGQVLSFGINGLTVVYGDNGSGKSGYCRILKKLCRVRAGGEEDIRGNAFDAASAGTRAEATVRFTVGAGSPMELRWKNGTETPDALSRISVFDTKTVALYADQQNKIEFLPHGLDVLTKLGGLCERLAGAIDNERNQLERRVATALPSVPAGTRAAGLLGRLAKGTPPQDLPANSEIEAACAWRPEHATVLEQTERGFLADPDALAKKCRGIAQTIRTIEAEIANVIDRVSPTAKGLYEGMWRRAQTAREAAALAAAGVQASDLLPGFGSDAWRSLFQHARAYSTIAYPSEPFPVTRADARCVFCQQRLGPETVARLKGFDAYVQGAAQAAADREERVRDNAKRDLEQTMVRSRDDAVALLALLTEEDPEAAKLTARVGDFLAALGSSKQALIGAFTTGDWQQISVLPESPLPALAESRARLEQKAAAYDATKSAEARGALEAKASDLNARKTLSSIMGLLLQRREDLDTLSRLAACRNACDTREISRKNTEFRKKYFTGEFENRLNGEIRNLDLEHLPLKIQDKSDHGANYLGVGLQAAVKVRNREVLSDGEFRALAIGCFLAEVNGIDGHNGIIIDDPVSSLDCQRTRLVARRLVDEARKDRQVIVFTHDLVFYHELRLAAAEHDVPTVYHWIRRTEEQGFGTIFENEEPWQAKKVKERLGDLQGKLATLRKVPEGSGDTYRQKVKDFYSDLRETWERLVEELLLNGVVGRFQKDVATQSLKGVVVEDADYRRVFFGMKRVSEYSGHDKPLAAHGTLPRHSDAEDDLAEIREFSEELRRRSRRVEDERKQLEKPPTGVTA